MSAVPSQTEQQEFYAGAYRRIVRAMLALAVVLTTGLWARYGWPEGVGFAIGAAVAVLNFYFLKRVVSAIADAITREGKQEKGSRVVVRFLARYFLIALAAYAIFRNSEISLYALFGGLFLPVAAIFAEAGYELYVALRRGI